MCISDKFANHYKKGEWYFADPQFTNENGSIDYRFRPSYWVYDNDNCFGTGRRFYIDNEKDLSSIILSDYFCTEQDLRKMKLKKIEPNE